MPSVLLPDEEPVFARRIKFLIGAVLVCGSLAVVLPLAWHTGWVVVGSNLHAVVPGEVYRSAQLSEGELREVVREKDIHTVINLRGPSPDEWYQAECRALEEMNVARHDVTMANYAWPTCVQISQLMEALDHCEYPVLLHCKKGADRTGIASAVALLIRTDASPEEAAGQLSWRYGHLPLFRRCELNNVLPLYQDWLRQRGQLHRPELFRQWVAEDYRPGPLWAKIEPLEVPTRLKRGQRAAAKFRVHNRSACAWQFKQGRNAGVHLGYFVRSEDGQYEATGGAGYFDATLPPGEFIDLTLALPAIHKAGRYRLTVDMGDEKLGWFSIAGSPLFETEIQVGN